MPNMHKILAAISNEQLKKMQVRGLATAVRHGTASGGCAQRRLAFCSLCFRPLHLPTAESHVRFLCPLPVAPLASRRLLPAPASTCGGAACGAESLARTAGTMLLQRSWRYAVQVQTRYKAPRPGCRIPADCWTAKRCSYMHAHTSAQQCLGRRCALYAFSPVISRLPDFWPSTPISRVGIRGPSTNCKRAAPRSCVCGRSTPTPRPTSTARWMSASGSSQPASWVSGSGACTAGNSSSRWRCVFLRSYATEHSGPFWFFYLRHAMP